MTYKTNKFRDYGTLYNPHDTSKDKKNPHKSYGYLIQPKLSQKFKEFMG